MSNERRRAVIEFRSVDNYKAFKEFVGKYKNAEVGLMELLEAYKELQDYKNLNRSRI